MHKQKKKPAGYVVITIQPITQGNEAEKQNIQAIININKLNTLYHENNYRKNQRK